MDKWISVKEKMPKHEQDCWVVIDDSTHGRIVIEARYHDFEGWTVGEDASEFNLKQIVNYWQPIVIPEPPTEAKEG